VHGQAVAPFPDGVFVATKVALRDALTPTNAPRLAEIRARLRALVGADLGE
jgi:hypothetical protein